jgi:Uma2 family endonuclease
MSTTTRLITADQLLVMPPYDENGNQCRFELIRGELKVMSPSKPLHGIVCANIAGELREFVKKHDLGVVVGAETGFLVERDPDSVLGVDAAFISHERLSTLEDLDKFAPFAPDLAVEVMSPSNTVREMEEKVTLYFAAGARAVWVLNPKKKTVAVYTSPTDVDTLNEQHTLDGGEVLPRFRVELSELFAAGKK